jgi:hypothetical protein
MIYPMTSRSRSQVETFLAGPVLVELHSFGLRLQFRLPAEASFAELYHSSEVGRFGKGCLVVTTSPWLVGLEDFLFFHILGIIFIFFIYQLMNSIIFQRGRLKPPTRWLFFNTAVASAHILLL